MYANIVFMQGDDADSAMETAEADCEADPTRSFAECLLDVLAMWDMGDESEFDVRPDPSYGTYDDVYESGDYVLSWSRSFGTCGLERKIHD